MEGIPHRQTSENGAEGDRPVEIQVPVIPMPRSIWSVRPLDPVYPVIRIDAIHVKVRDGQVTNRPIYVAIGVIVNGERNILGYGPVTVVRARSSGSPSSLSSSVEVSPMCALWCVMD